MNIIAIEDEPILLNALELAIKTAEPTCQVTAFYDAETALAWPGVSNCSVAFLDIELPHMSGLQAAQKLQEKNPLINIVFVTGFPQYTPEAMDIRASGYVSKPVTAEKILDELNNLRHPYSQISKPTLEAHCFGYFDVYVNEQPLPCNSAPAMELLALLIDRLGARCSVRMIESVLWGNRRYSKSHQSQLRRHAGELQHSLESVGCGDILVRQYGFIGLLKNRISCDYWDYLDGKIGNTHFNGEYMSQYSWAEKTLGNLLQIRESRLNDLKTRDNSPVYDW